VDHTVCGRDITVDDLAVLVHDDIRPRKLGHQVIAQRIQVGDGPQPEITGLQPAGNKMVQCQVVQDLHREILVGGDSNGSIVFLHHTV
jgi:hypothetical protein